MLKLILYTPLIFSSTFIIMKFISWFLLVELPYFQVMGILLLATMFKGVNFNKEDKKDHFVEIVIAQALFLGIGWLIHLGV